MTDTNLDFQYDCETIDPVELERLEREIANERIILSKMSVDDILFLN
jgi:hypothetical protein